VGPYLVESLLYKHMNRVWPFLIRHRLVRAAWRPLIEAGRLRHLLRRERLPEARPRRIRDRAAQEAA
jgi:hypothetical protein